MVSTTRNELPTRGFCPLLCAPSITPSLVCSLLRPLLILYLVVYRSSAHSIIFQNIIGSMRVLIQAATELGIEIAAELKVCCRSSPARMVGRVVAVAVAVAPFVVGWLEIESTTLRRMQQRKCETESL
jgi:hypothetical protein